MGLRVITPPSVEPVSLAEAKLHLRVDHDADDALIASLVSAAREECEHLLERALAPQTLQLLLDEWPAEIRMPKPPLVAVTSVQYVDASGVLVSLPADQYALDQGQEPSWVLPAMDADWPETALVANAVRVEYVAGYEAADCPPLIKQWIKLRVGTLYAYREADAERAPVASGFADRLIDRYRIVTI
jgi:uncharacterized phiE125 gp8 family phage protein